MNRLYPPCEVASRYTVPILRSLIAKELIEKYGFTQVDVAEKLGTTQAAISQYVHLKRGSKGTGHVENVLPAIQSAASEIAEGIAMGKMSSDEVTLRFCKLCTSLREEEQPSRK